MSSVSVIIPSYNYGSYLRDCVESVLSQPGPDVRILILDDASIDDTADIGQRLAGQDSRVEYRRHNVNQGYIATFNEGLAWADDDYMMLIDADDLLTHGALYRAVNLLDALPEVGFVYGHPVYFRAREPLPRARTGSYRWTVWSGHRWLELRCKAGTNCISSQTVVARTALRRRLGGYRPELPHTADMEVWMRLAVHADVAYIRGADQAWQRIHGASLQRTQFSSKLIDLRQRKAAFDWLFCNQGEALVENDQLHAMANRALAREALWRACRSYDRGRLSSDPVAELVQFALRTYPGACRLREWASLRWRQRVGPRICPYLQPLLVLAAVRQLRGRLWWRTWRLRGV
jgi:glycosyltransferase involved in cell wall biosynthesis